eukprot:1113454-Pleurochrysis_carterae.AAC.1
MRAHGEPRPVGRASDIPWPDTACLPRRLRQAVFASNSREGHQQVIGMILAGELSVAHLLSRRAQHPRVWAGRRLLARVCVGSERERRRACTCPRDCVCSCPVIE